MYSQINEPQQRLAKDFIKVTIINDTIENIVWYIILGVLFYLDHMLEWKEWIGWVLISIAIISVIASIWSFISPFLVYKNWRYDVSEEFVQLKSGAIREDHHLIPMTKIQAVSTVQGPLLKKYGLCTISIKTIGTSHTIPALPKEAAVELRNQIAAFAKIKEVE
ncbi:PH domain-containing protein [Brevibacillus daliensis]|uniref:PH domain-containing protein n=1 Tax=Brevibacillus daliensis TaxID=2892995 RepID=UPI001E5BB2BB|nr:PH domain-containing protein [Brevibacillus daliensis]